MTIMERIIEIAEEKHIKKADIYRNCGIPQSSFSSWTIANVTSIPSEYVVSVANYFGVSCDELLIGEKTVNRLNENEMNLIRKFNELDWDGRQIVLATLVNEKRRMEKESQSEG